MNDTMRRAGGRPAFGHRTRGEDMRRILVVISITVAALAVPTVAQAANEVTKWNEIAVSTVNAQPGITSAPPAGAVFIAMVQGAVYGAVNAADRHGKPYLINRSFPKASPDAAAATAAYRCCRRCSRAARNAGQRIRRVVDGDYGRGRGARQGGRRDGGCGDARGRSRRSHSDRVRVWPGRAGRVAATARADRRRRAIRVRG